MSEDRCENCVHMGRNKFKHFAPYCAEPTVCVEHECKNAYLNGSIKVVKQVPLPDARDICKSKNWTFYKQPNGVKLYLEQEVKQ